MPARPRAHLIYGLVDLAFAALYAYLIRALAPTRSGLIRAVVLLVAALLAAGGAGMISGKPWGEKLARAACITLIVGCVALIVALAASAAYLHGIYDGIGQAGSAIALICAALAIELVGLLPALQLAYLRRLRLAGAGASSAAPAKPAAAKPVPAKPEPETDDAPEAA